MRLLIFSIPRLKVSEKSTEEKVHGLQCLWVSKLLPVRGDVISWVSKNVTREDNSYMCTWFIYKLQKELFFLYFLGKINSVWFGCKLQNRVIFLVNTSMRGTDTIDRFQARWNVKTTVAIKHFSLLSELV